MYNILAKMGCVQVGNALLLQHFRITQLIFSHSYIHKLLKKKTKLRQKPQRTSVEQHIHIKQKMIEMVRRTALKWLDLLKLFVTSKC